MIAVALVKKSVIVEYILTPNILFGGKVGEQVFMYKWLN